MLLGQRDGQKKVVGEESMGTDGQTMVLCGATVTYSGFWQLSSFLLGEWHPQCPGKPPQHMVGPSCPYRRCPDP